MVTTQEVIEALKQEGFVDDEIKVLVPILAYESRENGVPYVLTAIDTESPSYGLGQANVDTMESAYWMAFNEYNIDLPGQTQQQADQWRRAGYDVSEEDVRDFTPEQRKFVIDYMQTADLEFHAKLIKHMFHQKELESDMNFEQALQDLYKLTIAKFNQPDKHPESVAFKSTIDAEVEDYYSMPPTTTTTTTPTTTTTLPPEDNNTATLYDRNGKPVTGIDPDIVEDMLLSGLFFETPPNTTPPTVDVGMNERSPGITNQFGTPPQNETNTDTGGRKSVADKFNENFNRDVGPITQKFRDRAAAKEDKSIMQIIEMLTASVNKKRSEQGMEELDRQTVLNNRTNQLEEEETKIQFPGSGVPLDIEDVLDFLTT